MRRGIAFGVATALAFMAMLIGGFGVLLQSGIQAHAPVDRYASVTAVVSGKQSVTQIKMDGKDKTTESQPLLERARVPVSEAASLRTVPGVTNVVADYSFPVVDSTGTLTAHGWDSTALTSTTLASGHTPESSNQVVLDSASDKKVGDTVQLQTNGTSQTFEVSGTVDQGTATAYFSQSEAAALSGHPDTADALVVLGNDVSTTALQQATGPGQVVATGDARGDVEDISVNSVKPTVIGIGASLGGVAVLIAMLVITALLEMSVRDRTRELAVMRAVGALPRQVRRMIVRETLKIAVPAALIGGTLSLALGAALHSVMVSQGFLPAAFALTLSPIPAVAAALITVLTALGSAWLASRRVSRIRPVQALGEAATEPTKLAKWRVVTGLVFLALGGGMLAVTMLVGGQAAATSIGGLVVSLIWAVALLGPWIARVGIRVLGWPLKALSPIAGGLAATGARAAAVRMAAVITPIALGISFGATQLVAQSSVSGTTKAQAIDGLRADQVLVSSGPGVPHSAYDAVSAIPGVTGVTAVKRTNVVMNVHGLGTTLESLSAEGISGSSATIDPHVVSGSLDALTGTDTVALSSAVADGAAIGSVQPMWLGDGTEIQPRLVAVYDSGFGFGDVLLPHDIVAAHSTVPGVDDYLLVDGTADLSGATAKYDGVHATSKAAYGAALTKQADQNSLVNLIAVGAIAGFILIGVVTTLAVATASRRRELTLLRLVGATRKQVMRALRLETLIVLGTGTLVGALVAGVTMFAFAGGVTAGSLTVPPLLCAAIVGAVAIPGMAAVMLPARSMLRRGSPKIQ